MHRLLLRQAPRAVRAQNVASSSRTALRAISTTPRSRFGATGAVQSKKMAKFDPSLFDGLDGLFGEAAKESAKQENRAETAEAEGAEVVLSENVPELVSFSTREFRPDEYFSQWLSQDAKSALETLGQTQIDYFSSLLETDATWNALGGMAMTEVQEFERLVELYEGKMDTDPQAVVPLLSFLLRHGVEFKAPSEDFFSPDESVRLIDPQVVKKALKTVDQSVWRIVDETKVPREAYPYPDLREPDALLDPRDEVEFPAEPDQPFTNRVIVRNHLSVFHDYAPPFENGQPVDELMLEDELSDDTGRDADNMLNALTVSPQYYRNLHQAILMRRNVVQQTGKGKIRRISFLVLVGDGNGLVGYGEGKHATGATALKMARLAAVRNMDWVERFEKRTIWTEMSTKLGATQIIMRPRPVGFGLRCNPYLHQILRAAGFKDISAKVWGSRNRLNVIKACFRMLHAGHAPTGMGDGVGGKAKKLSKGVGVKGKAELERARGRKLISLRK